MGTPTTKETIMNRMIVGTFIAAGLMVGGFTAGASAAQPANPGCFGQDRAAWLHGVGQTSDAAPGASEWGHIAGDRAGDNGTINQAYRLGCGG